MLHTRCNRFLSVWEIISIFKYDGILEQENNSITFGHIIDPVPRMVILILVILIKVSDLFREGLHWDLFWVTVALLPESFFWSRQVCCPPWEPCQSPSIQCSPLENWQYNTACRSNPQLWKGQSIPHGRLGIIIVLRAKANSSLMRVGKPVTYLHYSKFHTWWDFTVKGAHCDWTLYDWRSFRVCRIKRNLNRVYLYCWSTINGIWTALKLSKQIPLFWDFFHIAVAFLSVHDHQNGWWKTQKKRIVIVHCHQNLLKFPNSSLSVSFITSVFTLWFKWTQWYMGCYTMAETTDSL